MFKPQRAKPFLIRHISISNCHCITYAIFAAIALSAPLHADVWVDFNYTGAESGTESEPFNTLAEGVADADPAETIKIKAGSSAEFLTLTQAQTLEAVNGTVRIGASGWHLTVTIIGDGSVSHPTGYYAPGVLSITATPGSGWAFLRWEGDASGSSNPLNLTVDADKSIVARFSPPGADLRVDSVTILTDPASAAAGETLEVQWEVENTGQTSATGGWTDAIYLSRDAVLDEDIDKRLDEESISGPLASGATYVESKVIMLPDVAPGAYWLLVKTDDLDDISESIESLDDNGGASDEEALILDPVMREMPEE